MKLSSLLLIVTLTMTASNLAAGEPNSWWSAEVEQALAKAKFNRMGLEKALAEVSKEQRAGMAFLIANMPAVDLRSLSAEYLLKNCELAYKARAATPWGRDIPEAIFLNDVLPYANVDETRDEWRQEFFDTCLPMIKGCKTPSEAAHKLNGEIFKRLDVRYSTKRKAPNQSPRESIEGKTASCTGLSIVLSDACRAVCVPARLVGTPLWSDKRGNHTWVEVWDKGWHFTGACEPDPSGLNRGWFVGAAAQAQKDSFVHAIYAASFKRSNTHFPLVWAMQNKDVAAENVTDRYAKPQPKATTVRVSIRVVDANGKRVAKTVTATARDDAKVRLEGKSKTEMADANDFLTFELQPARDYVIRVADVELVVRTQAAGEQQVVEVKLP